MSIDLNPHFNATLYIVKGSASNQGDIVPSEVLYEQKFNSKSDCYAFIQRNGTSIEGSSLLRATIIPTRTSNKSELLQDVLLPTFVNHALNIENLFSKVIGSMFAIMLDILTLIPRLIATPFKIKADQENHTEHPVIALIRNNPQAAESIQSGVVKFKIVGEDVGHPSNDRKYLFYRTYNEYLKVVIKTLPGISSAERGYNGSRKYYMDATGMPNVEEVEKDGKWLFTATVLESGEAFDYSC
jgi:hypothetical protein